MTDAILSTVKHVPAWLPGAGWKRMVPLWSETLKGVCQIPHDFVKRQMVRRSDMRNASFRAHLP